MTFPRPIVSVITPTYNSMGFIKNLIFCLKAQTVANWECLLVDDGSKDGTREFLQTLTQEDRRFRLFLKEPGGNPTIGRNIALNNAEGDYVAFCDHDDFWHPRKLELQLEAFKIYPSAVICHTTRLLWRSNKLPTEFPSLEFNPELVQIESPYEVLYAGCRIANSSTLIPRAKAQEVHFLNEALKGVDDFHFFIKLSNLGEIIRIKLPLMYYYWHDRNLSHVANLFVVGLHQMAEELKKEKASLYVYNVIKAQAYKSEAVGQLVTHPIQGIILSLKSFLKHPRLRTCGILAVAHFFVVVPRSVRQKMFDWLLAHKEE